MDMSVQKHIEASKTRPSLAQRFNQGLILVTGAVVATSSMAATDYFAAGLAAMEDVTNQSAALFAIGFLALVGFAVWRYTKRGANSA